MWVLARVLVEQWFAVHRLPDGLLHNPACYRGEVVILRSARAFGRWFWLA